MSRKSIALAFQIAVVLLCVEAIRYLIVVIIKSFFQLNDIITYLIALFVAIIILAFLINGFSSKKK